MTLNVLLSRGHPVYVLLHWTSAVDAGSLTRCDGWTGRTQTHSVTDRRRKSVLLVDTNDWNWFYFKSAKPFLFNFGTVYVIYVCLCVFMCVCVSACSCCVRSAALNWAHSTGVGISVPAGAGSLRPFSCTETEWTKSGYWMSRNNTSTLLI